MLKRSVAISALLTLFLISACVVEAAPATPAPTPEPTAATVVEPSVAPQSVSERDAIIDYLSSLSQISSEFTASLDDANITVITIPGGGVQRLKFTGSIEAILTIYTGFSSRVDQAQPGPDQLDLREIHAIVTRAIARESQWIAEYEAAATARDFEFIELMEWTYFQQIPFAQLNLIDDRIVEILASHNIPMSQVGYDPATFRLIILQNDYFDPKFPVNVTYEQLLEEPLVIQAAVDLLIADRALDNTTMIASVANTSDFSAVDFDSSVAGVQPLFPNYLQQNPTICAYTWDVEGRVSQASCPPSSDRTLRIPLRVFF